MALPWTGLSVTGCVGESSSVSLAWASRRRLARNLPLHVARSFFTNRRSTRAGAAGREAFLPYTTFLRGLPVKSSLVLRDKEGLSCHLIPRRLARRASRPS